MDIEVIFDAQGKAYCLDVPLISLTPPVIELSPIASRLKKAYTIIKNNDSSSEFSDNDILDNQNGNGSRRFKSTEIISEHFLEIVQKEKEKY